MPRPRASLVALLAVVLAGCGPSLLVPPDEPDPPPFEFRLGPGDRIEVDVWGEEELGDQVMELGPDGKVAFALIGDVDLSGLTLDEARVELAQRLKAMLEDPVVSVSLIEMRSHVVHVAGEVARPGSVPFVRGASVLGALQAAGGLLPATADLGGVRVVRDRLGERRAYVLDVAAVLGGEARDMWLLPGDLVYVPPRLLTRWDRWWRQASPWGDAVDPPARR